MLRKTTTYHLKPKRGFTLIELLIAMAILAILSTIGFGNFQTARIKARDAKRKTDLAAVAKALEAYVNDHRTYPLADTSGQIVGCGAVAAACSWGSRFSDGTSTYMAALPADSGGYTYRYASNGTTYTLYAYLENTEDASVIPNPDQNILCAATKPCNYKITSSNQ